MDLPDGIVRYSSLEVERLSQLDLRRRVDVDFVPPINIELLIENSPDAWIEADEALAATHRVEGCLCKQYMTRNYIVHVDAQIMNSSWPKYNAVLGEEYAHMQLHGAFFYLVNSVEDFLDLQRDPQWSEFERDAKLYSTAIRMPTDLIVQESERIYPRIVDELGFGDPVQVEVSISQRLATRFRVEATEMRRRLTSSPCNLRTRIFNSVQAAEPSLVPASWCVSASPPPPGSQRTLFSPK